MDKIPRKYFWWVLGGALFMIFVGVVKPKPPAEQAAGRAEATSSAADAAPSSVATAFMPAVDAVPAASVQAVTPVSMFSSVSAPGLTPAPTAVPQTPADSRRAQSDKAEANARAGAVGMGMPVGAPSAGGAHGNIPEGVVPVNVPMTDEQILKGIEEQNQRQGEIQAVLADRDAKAAQVKLEANMAVNQPDYQMAPEPEEYVQLSAPAEIMAKLKSHQLTAH